MAQAAYDEEAFAAEKQKMLKAFDSYDINGDGCISRDEFAELVTMVAAVRTHHSPSFLLGMHLSICIMTRYIR